MLLLFPLHVLSIMSRVSYSLLFGAGNVSDVDPPYYSAIYSRVYNASDDHKSERDFGRKLRVYVHS